MNSEITAAAPSALKLFFARAGDEINNADLFVWAADTEQAAALWRAYFDPEPEAMPTEVFEVPHVPPATACALPWHETGGVVPAAPRIKIGGRYRFDYPAAFTTLPDYTAHAGQAVTVLRQLTDAECDPECQPMFEIKADDGWTGCADGDELSPLVAATTA